MSEYGSASAVVITPFVASQELRESLRARLPDCVAIPDHQPVSAQSLTALAGQAAERGLLAPSELSAVAAGIPPVLRLGVARAATETLTELGFQVRQAHATTSTLWAERGHQVMALEVLDGGGFSYDLAGLEGGRCAEVLTGFRDGMARRGVTFQVAGTRHNDPRGGQLIRRVLRATSPQQQGRAAGVARGRQGT